MSKEILAPGVSLSRFSTPLGCEEAFLIIVSDAGLPFSEALQQLQRKHAEALTAAGLCRDTHLFSRLYLGDVANQDVLVRQSPLFADLDAGAVSIVGQPCADGGSVCLFSYHLRDSQSGSFVREKSLGNGPGRNDLFLRMRNYSILLNAGYCGRGEADTERQTREILASVGAQLASRDMTLLHNAVRTWVFVRDIDNHYRGMVTARREFFAANGLNEKTRFLASTGIEGRTALLESLVAVDAMSIGNLAPGQTLCMHAPDRMPRPIDYGVTFERGLRVRFGDRSHLYVSGTASIDVHGQIAHWGDIERQTETTIENLFALLRAQGADADSLMYLFAYVRDFHDVKIVRDVLSGFIDGRCPVLCLHASICRPAWLVEMEGVAIVPDHTNYPAFG